LNLKTIETDQTRFPPFARRTLKRTA
jgi:hypothetical protein